MQNNYYTSGCMISWDGYCPNCHKPYFYIGDVPEHGWPKGMEPICTCGKEKTVIAKQGTSYGWQCPVCGQVNAPWVAVCNGWHGNNYYTVTITNMLK